MPIAGSKPGIRKALLCSAATLTAVTALSAGAANAETTDDLSAAATCTLATIPLPSGTNSSEVLGMSADGTAITYMAFTAASPNTTRAFVRVNGRSTEVNLPGTNDRLYDVNDSGRAVGLGSNTAGNIAYAWEDGVLTRLSTGSGVASSINEAGDIAGSIGTSSATRAVYWPAGSTTPVQLAVPAGAVWSSAESIAEDGTVVGLVNFGWEHAWLTKPYVWHPDGTYEELAGPTDIGDEEYLSVEDAVGNTAVGYIGGLGSSDTGLRWDLTDGTYEEIGLPYVLDVNSSGTVAGNNGTHAAFETTSGAVTTLPGLTATGYSVAQAIADSGKFLSGKVRSGSDANGRSLFRAATWTCA